MDGVLLIDKPSGITSHDVVSWARRRISQRDIGHTGTLDPMATGLLVLVLGKATRLSSRLTGKDKRYEAEIRLGFATDTDDADGEALGEPAPSLPSDQEIQDVLRTFLGTFDQRPPAHSAKKLGGRPAYELARRQEPVELTPVPVVLSAIEWVGRDDDRVRIDITTGAGFYVRALARDLGERLGCGAHLSGLRRTASGSFSVADAVTLAAADDRSIDLASRLISPAAALPELAAVSLTEGGLRRALHGNPIAAQEVAQSPEPRTGTARILAADGRLVALAEWRSGVLHPVVVLG
jgi:tRNA pseudouridine55 synthase